ncbi:cation:proton antiporter [Nocardioides donggukensis]|uniref:Cation:proton antiporter n=1 Tax=Nocardioides donggukensis TaxID=2774019 RepID=A0A927PZV4_9ACTN|nr:cation:proton antiporter [Nocardioides donggukensis]MBD8869790.1 cation:proton antiporter [Nocardioides donggukensis]
MVELLLIALSVLAFALVSGRLAMTPVTAPMVFTTIGLVVGVGGLGWFDLELEGEAVSILVEATLVLVLFTDAIRIDLRVMRRQATLPGRMLGIGMPLTILAGTGVALLVVPELGIAEAALLAAVLAPTDAALGQAVVSDRRLPVRIRQALNVESGLNDGIAVPVVTVLLAVTVAEEVGGASDWLELAARQVGFGVLVGLALGALGGRLLDHRASAGAVEGVYRQLATIAIAVSAFALAGVLDGNGFIAAFTAGLAFGQVARRQCHGVQDFTEDEGELLGAVTFLIFGAAVVGPVLGDLSWQIAGYVVASLTVVRMVPVFLSLTGSGTLIETRLFFGWFGPRGLASILFALLVAEGLETEGGELVFTIAAWTVLVSVFAHGMTASPWAGRLGRRLAAETEAMTEIGPAEELPTRRRLAP